MKEQLEEYVRKVKERHEDCRGSEQATKASLIAPLFAILGYDLADPKECKPEYKVDFGKYRSTKPIDWAFAINGAFVFFVEAKAVGKSLDSYSEQLGDYFAKELLVKLGILTNGIEWKFFMDLIHDNVMDKEPFFVWNVLNDDPAIVMDLMTILQKSQFKAQHIRTFAEKKHHQNLLVNQLNRLLEPAAEFTKLAIVNIETRNLTQAVVDYWKPIVASAIGEWAKQRTLASVLAQSPSKEETNSTTEGEGEHNRHERYGLRKRFWQALLGRPKVKNTRHADIAASEYSWIGAGSGVRGLPFSYAVTQEEGRVELWIDRGAGKTAENKEIFDRIQIHKEEIERTFGSELSWQRLDGKQSCRIAYIMKVGGYRSDESKWPEIQDAMIDAMIRLEKALTPHLAKLKTELASEGA